MQVSEIQLDQTRAGELLEKYVEHKDSATDDDLAIMKAYKAIAEGQVLIQAHESIRQAGWDMDQGRPVLAICRAHKPMCYLDQTIRRHGPDKGAATLTFREHGGWSPSQYDGKRNLQQIEVGADLTPEWLKDCRGKAVVPLVPLNLRPKRGLHLYHILWEADWQNVPIDPMLIRKLSGDLWMVVAAWDLTDVERAVIADRLSLA